MRGVDLLSLLPLLVLAVLCDAFSPPTILMIKGGCIRPQGRAWTRGSGGRVAESISMQDGDEKGAKDFSAGKGKGGITRRDAVLGFGLSFVPALIASAIAGQDAPAPLDTSVRVAVEEKPSKELLALRGIEKWSDWSSSDVSFDYTYEKAESIYVLEGEATVKPTGGSAGKAVTLVPGMFVTFPKGYQCHWDVTKPVKKKYKEYEAILSFD